MQTVSQSVLASISSILIPELFKTQIINTFDERGAAWINQLPRLIEYACDKWQLINIQTVNNISFNYVAFGFSNLLNTNIVLKISPDITEYNKEKTTLLY